MEHEYTHEKKIMILVLQKTLVNFYFHRLGLSTFELWIPFSIRQILACCQSSRILVYLSQILDEVFLFHV